MKYLQVIKSKAWQVNNTEDSLNNHRKKFNASKSEEQKC